MRCNRKEQKCVLIQLDVIVDQIQPATVVIGTKKAKKGVRKNE
nr:MAG TPA: hypothetical protein [Caudoviricetes sp.]